MYAIITNDNEAAYVVLQHTAILVWARRPVVRLAPQVRLTPLSPNTRRENQRIRGVLTFFRSCLTTANQIFITILDRYRKPTQLTIHIPLNFVLVKRVRSQ